MKSGVLNIQSDRTRYNILPFWLKIYVIVLSTVGVLLAIRAVYAIVIPGVMILDYTYFYLLFACFLSCVYLILPAVKADQNRIPVYDVILSFLMLAIGVYYAVNSYAIALVGWGDPAGIRLITGTIFVILNIEAARRGGGGILACICAVFTLYPLVAQHMPGILYGPSLSFRQLVFFHVYTSTGLPGLMASTLGYYVLGFIVFSGFMLACGCGDFFMDLSNALLGRYRGGPAKVSIISSMMFGMLSGSAVANVIGTGTFTIPAMKKSGYPPMYAAAIEACASTGGMFMPPVMGTVAFVMAAQLGIEYAAVAIAALIPACLYYYGLLVQSDIVAVRLGMRGLPAAECPKTRNVLKHGWHYLLVVVFLVWGLLYMHWEMKTPFYAVALLIVLSLFNKKYRMTPKRFLNAFTEVGIMLAELVAVLLPIGLIVSGLKCTGVGFSMTSELVLLGGSNIVLILVFGMFACYIMGMAGLISAAYIFLAVSMAPAAIQVGGLNPMAVHLFIVYYACLASITPPVAAAAFVGAQLAGCDKMKTGFVSMKMGIVVYIVPFFFVFNPALIMQSGTWFDTLYLTVFAIIGITLFTFGLQGYLYKVGHINWVMRVILLITGLLVAWPGVLTSVIGMAVAVAAIGYTVVVRGKKTNQPLLSA